MRHYQLSIDGVFVHAPELGSEIGGFYTTFFLAANNAPNAKHRACVLLTDRMNRHRVSPAAAWPTSAYFCVSDLLEVSEERAIEKGSVDLGFTFYRIGFVDRFTLAVRGTFLRRFRRWKLLPTR